MRQAHYLAAAAASLYSWSTMEKKGTIRELACRKNPHNQVTENKTKPEEMKYENSTTQNLLK